MADKKRKLRWTLGPDETMKDLIVNTYLDTYHERKDAILTSFHEAPGKIKASKYYNGKVWAAIICIVAGGLMLLSAQSRISESEAELKAIQNEIAAIQQERGDQKSYYFSLESTGNAETLLTEVLEILNDMQDTQSNDRSADLSKYLGGKAAGDAYWWGQEYDNNYVWTGRVNRISTDDDIVEIILVLTNQETKQPGMYMICEYSVSKDLIIKRTGVSVYENKTS